MLYRRVLFFSFLMIFVSVRPQTWPSFFIQDAKDTLSTGMPIALSAAFLWFYANRIPHDWQTIEGPVADFIYATWKEQGLVREKPIALKRIPPGSVLGKIVGYTQELPRAVAIGDLFIKRVKRLLDAKNNLLNQPKTVQRDYELEKIEDELDECRFVCGHERVHKECNHAYKFLILQCLAPFFVYSGLKHARAVMVHNQWKTPFDWSLSRGLTRSSIELVIGIIFARYIEYQADIYASDDPKIVRAGLHLFQRAQNSKTKRSFHKPSQHMETALKWIFKYAHPTLIERIAYMKKRLEYLEKKREQRNTYAL